MNKPDLYVLGALLALAFVCLTALALVGTPVPTELGYGFAALTGALTGAAVTRKATP